MPASPNSTRPHKWRSSTTSFRGSLCFTPPTQPRSNYRVSPKATGQSTDLNPDLAGQLLAGARQSIQDSFRGPDRQAPFGAIQQAPDDATTADQLAAFLGRSL